MCEAYQWYMSEKEWQFCSLSQNSFNPSSRVSCKLLSSLAASALLHFATAKREREREGKRSIQPGLVCFMQTTYS